MMSGADVRVSGDVRCSQRLKISNPRPASSFPPTDAHCRQFLLSEVNQYPPSSCIRRRRPPWATCTGRLEMVASCWSLDTPPCNPSRPFAPVVLVAKLFPEMPVEEQTALWQSKEELYRTISTKMTPLPGLSVFLERCDAAGVATIIVTNAPRPDAVHTLKVLGLWDR